ncbi:MAG: hypothetical protein QXF01_01720 [Candidatus Micrarchaeaceae archaeon]
MEEGLALKLRKSRELGPPAKIDGKRAVKCKAQRNAAPIIGLLRDRGYTAANYAGYSKALMAWLLGGALGTSALYGLYSYSNSKFSFVIGASGPILGSASIGLKIYKRQQAKEVQKRNDLEELSRRPLPIEVQYKIVAGGSFEQKVSILLNQDISSNAVELLAKDKGFNEELRVACTDLIRDIRESEKKNDENPASEYYSEKLRRQVEEIMRYDKALTKVLSAQKQTHAGETEKKAA